VRALQVRRQVLGPGAPPLLVVGPRPLRRALHAYAQLEPLTFVYLDNAATLVSPTLQSNSCAGASCGAALRADVPGCAVASLGQASSPRARSAQCVLRSSVFVYVPRRGRRCRRRRPGTWRPPRPGWG
jgi:hypothetical protein